MESILMYSICKAIFEHAYVGVVNENKYEMLTSYQWCVKLFYGHKYRIVLDNSWTVFNPPVLDYNYNID